MTKSKNSVATKATAKVVAKGQQAKAAKPAPAAKTGKAKTPPVVNAVKTPQATTAAKTKKIGGLDAAAMILKAKGEPMTCKAIMDEILAKSMWKTNGKTPAATIYAAMLREIRKGPQSRFRKTDRGLFAANG